MQGVRSTNSENQVCDLLHMGPSAISLCVPTLAFRLNAAKGREANKMPESSCVEAHGVNLEAGLFVSDQGTAGSPRCYWIFSQYRVSS